MIGYQSGLTVISMSDSVIITNVQSLSNDNVKMVYQVKNNNLQCLKC